MIVYGVYYNPCIFESAAGLISLHFSKANAWKRVRQLKYGKAVSERENHKHRMKGWTKMKPPEWSVYFLEVAEISP